MKLTTYPNGLQLKAKNKRFVIFKVEENGKSINRIEVKSLTKETGAEIGAISFISKNSKVKYSAIGFSDEALMELYCCLDSYLKKQNTFKPI